MVVFFENLVIHKYPITFIGLVLHNPIFGSGTKPLFYVNT
jgi:hypothetical protein